MPAVLPLKGIRQRILPDPVEIDFAMGTVPGTEFPVSLPGLPHHDIRRQQAVGGPQDAIRRYPPVRKEIHYLPVGVHPCVCPSGSSQLNGIAENQGQLFLQYILYGGHRRQLALEAMKLVNVILDSPDIFI